MLRDCATAVDRAVWLLLLQAGILDIMPPYMSLDGLLARKTRVGGPALALAWPVRSGNSVECRRRHCISAPDDCLQNDSSIIVLQG